MNIIAGVSMGVAGTVPKRMKKKIQKKSEELGISLGFFKVGDSSRLVLNARYFPMNGQKDTDAYDVIKMMLLDVKNCFRNKARYYINNEIVN